MRYAKTDAGQQAFKARSPLFSARQRSLFILLDGVKTLNEVLDATTGLGTTPADAEYLLTLGLIALVDSDEPMPSAGASVAGPSTPPAPVVRSPAQRYAEAYPLAVKLAAGLGLRGFTLNLAVEAATNYENLAALLPRLQHTLGPEACVPLERALFDPS
jgi:hypothetical protein